MKKNFQSKNKLSYETWFLLQMKKIYWVVALMRKASCPWWSCPWVEHSCSFSCSETLVTVTKVEIHDRLTLLHVVKADTGRNWLAESANTPRSWLEIMCTPVNWSANQYPLAWHSGSMNRKCMYLWTYTYIYIYLYKSVSPKWIEWKTASYWKLLQITASWTNQCML